VAEELDVGFLLKGSPDFLHQLRRYLSEHLFFGDFVFRDQQGRELDRAADLKDLVKKLHAVPAESVAYHAMRHDFSRWLRARAEFGLASRLRPRKFEDFPTVEALRDTLISEIDRHRRERVRGSVNPFRSEFFDGQEGIVQIGGGSLGGKGRGLAFASRLLDEVRLSDRFPGIRITVPAAVALGTAVFDQFLDENRLRSFALQSEDQAETLRRILAAPLPGDVMEALRKVVAVVHTPLAVRSSSLLQRCPPPCDPAGTAGGRRQAGVREHLRRQGQGVPRRHAVPPRGGGDGRDHPAGGRDASRGPLLPAHLRCGPLTQLLSPSAGEAGRRDRRRGPGAREDRRPG
jgi:hypothetical protein